MTGNSKNLRQEVADTQRLNLVSVCICTYRRPHLLDCLKSIANQALPENYSIRIIVVDNCPDNSAAQYVKQFSDSSTIDVDYLSCHRKNLSSVRNKAIQAASGQYIALVDDDEVVSQHWLKHLVECSQKYHADVVIGPVNNKYSKHCPAWLKHKDLMARKSPPTGKQMNTGHSGNALIKPSFLSSNKLVFDEQLGRSGSEDTDFFFRLYKNGAKIVACREATACETVDPDRENMSFLVQDNKRVGQAFCRVFWPRYTLRQKFLAVLLVLTKVVGFGLAYLLTKPFGKQSSSYWKLRSVCNNEKIRYLIRKDKTIYRYCV